MLKGNKFILGLFTILMTLAFSACHKEQKHKTKIQVNQLDTINLVESINKIYYSLPSPLEIANVIQSKNIEFYSEFLFPTSQVLNFQSDDAKSVALGIYSADLSFCVVFSQQQLAMEYFDVIKQLATELDLVTVITDSVMNLIEQNLNNIYELQRIVGQILFKVDALLEESQRKNTALLSIYSGWIESLYLTISFCENTNDDTIRQNIYQTVADQYLVVDDVISMLQASNLKERDKLINYTKEIKNYLKNLINITYKNEYDPYSDQVIKRKVINYTLKQEDIKKLKQIITKIRNKVIAKVS